MTTTIDLLQIRIDKAKAQLPEDTRDAIDSVDWKTVIFEMRQRKGYNLEQLENLEMETELVLCGLLAPSNYQKELENRMHLNQAQSNDLVNDMNRLVFSKIKEELIRKTEKKKKPTIQIYPKGVPVKPAPSIMPNLQEETNGSEKILSTAGIEIISTDSSTQKPVIPPVQIKIDKPAPLEPPKTETPAPEIPTTWYWADEPEKPTIVSPSPEQPIEIIKKEEEKPLEINYGELQQGLVDSEIHPIYTQKMSGSFQMPSAKTEHTLENITKSSGAETKPAPPTSYPKNADPYRLPPE